MGGNRTGSCTGPDRSHREPAEPDQIPPVLRTLVLGVVLGVLAAYLGWLGPESMCEEV
jgi:hypothetical protein